MCTKISYKSHSAAATEMHRFQNFDAAVCRVYLCPDCGNFHLTSDAEDPIDVAARRKKRLLKLYRMKAAMKIQESREVNGLHLLKARDREECSTYLLQLYG